MSQGDEYNISNKLAFVKYYLDAGNLAEANAACQSILAINPKHKGALEALCVIAFQSNTPEKAVDCYRQLIEMDATNYELYLMLGRACLAAGMTEQALKSLDTARQINPTDSRIFLSYGKAFQQSGDTERAVDAFKEAIRLDPSFVPAYMALGKQKELSGDLDDAGNIFETAASIHPAGAQINYNLGVIRFKQGNFHEALNRLKEVVRLQPRNTDAYGLMGIIHQLQLEMESAIDVYQKMVSLEPDNPEHHSKLATILSKMGQIDESAASYDVAIQLSPDKILWKLRKASLCPVVFGSCDEIHEYRSQLLDELAEFSGKIQATPAELVDNEIYPQYALTFHGLNDREIRTAYASLFSECFPSNNPRPQNDRARIGFVVNTFHEGVFVRSMKGVLKHLDRKMFEPVIVCTDNGASIIKHRMPDVKISLMVVPDSIEQMASAISAANFDIIYYWEVATDPVNYFLPFYRLAPVQCTSWGVQVTTGIRNVDYYLSCDLTEVESGQGHYSEHLILSNALLTYQYPRQLPDRLKTREDFGFGSRENLYLCPQLLGKIHPDFDKCLGEILRHDPNGRIVLIGGRLPHVVGLLKQRLLRNIPDVIDRIVFLPKLDENDYANIISVCDLLIDPHRYGGVNTTYDGLSFEKPIVTMPTSYQIGRYSSACLSLIGATECIVSSEREYIDTAVRIGTDLNFQQMIRDKIRSSRHLIFKDMNAVREHERLFSSMLDNLH